MSQTLAFQRHVYFVCRNPSGRTTLCSKAIKIKVQVESVTSQEEIELQIDSKTARVHVSHEGDLNVELPFEVEERKGHARFLTEKKELEITLPVRANQSGLLSPSQSRDLPAAADGSRDSVSLPSETCHDHNEDTTSEEPIASRPEHVTKGDRSVYCTENKKDRRQTANEIQWTRIHAQRGEGIAECRLYPVPSISLTDTSTDGSQVQTADGDAVFKEPTMRLDNIMTID